MFDNPKDDFWGMDWLKQIYQSRVVENILCQSWAIDEVSSGECSIDNLIGEIWDGYEAWAEENFCQLRYEEVL